MITADNLQPKIRLRHLLRTYAPSLSESYLARRMHGELTKRESNELKKRGLEPLADRYLVKTIECDAITNRLRLPAEQGYGPKIVIDMSFAVSAAHVIAAETLADLRPSADDIASRARAITQYIIIGTPAPIGIFSGRPFEGEEVTDEYGLKRPSNGEARAFLRGAIPSWSCAAHVAIARRQEDDIVTALVEEGCRLVLLTSAAGDGKTTMLMRVAMNLRHRGWNVLFVNSPGRGGMLPSIPKWSTPVCVLIDHADMAGDYSGLEAALLRDERVYVVLAARDIEWRHAGHGFVAVRSRKVFIGTIDEREADLLAQCIARHGATSAPIGEEALRQRLLASSHSKFPHLLAAMMSATHAASFEDIVRDMIVNLERIGKDWLLRLVACGTYTHELTDYAMGRLSFWMIERIIADRIGSNDSAAVHNLLNGMKSEIVRVGATSATATSLFDVRHPDIARIALSHCYGLDLDAPEAGSERLINDLCKIVGAAVSVSVDRGSRVARYEEEYLHKVPECWLSAALHSEHAEAVSVGRALFEYAIARLGNTEHELARKVSLLQGWAAIEETLQGARTDLDAEQYAPDALYARAVAIAPKAVAVWCGWGAFAVRRKRFGFAAAKDGPEINSARWIFRRAYEQGMLENPEFAIHWASFEAATDNPGFEFEPFSARWIFREGWTECRKSKSELALRWAAFEAPTNPGGADEPAKYSARWIYRTAWKLGHVSASLAVSWASFEAKHAPAGHGPAAEDAAKNAARTIFREASNYTACRTATLVIAWAKVEAGEARRSLYREAWENWGLHDPSIATSWAYFELQCTDADVSAEGRQQAARAILLEAWKFNSCRTAVVAQMFGQMDMKNNAGDLVAPAANTARSIFRSYLAESLRKGDWQFAWVWAREEVRAGNAGSTDAEYSARWIARQFTDAHPKRADMWVLAAIIEALVGNMGEAAAPVEGSARGLFRYAWTLPGYDEEMARKWAKFELQQASAEPGTDNPWSAAGIFEKCQDRFKIVQTSVEEWIRVAGEEAEADVECLDDELGNFFCGSPKLP